MLLTFTMAATLLEPATVPASAHAARKPSPQCPAERPDETSAALTAKLCKKRIRVSGLTSERAETFANPNGTLTTSQHARPVRVRRGTGWIPADTTLRVGSDGSVRPAAVPMDLMFSGGGKGPLLKAVTTDGQELSLGSPVGVLPKPVLAGDTAIYPEVLPGVDLKVTASVDGFSEALVVKSPAAAADPALKKLRFPTRTKGLTATSGRGGRMAFVTPERKPVFVSSAAEMWDTAHTRAQAGKAAAKASDPTAEPASQDAGHSGKSKAEGRRTVLTTRLADGALEVLPDAAMLADPATVFPVTIDPAFSVSPHGWYLIDSATPNTVNYAPADFAQAGTWNGGANKRRSLFNFGTGIRNKHILSAQFKIRETWSWNCSPREVELMRTPWVGVVSWNTAPAANLSFGRKNEAHGWSASCPAADIGWDIRAGLQENQDKGQDSISFLLKAVSETDNTYWKKFDPNAWLEITYNTLPTVGALSTSPATPCVTGDKRPVINTRTPQLRAEVRDDEGFQSMSVGISWWQTGGSQIGYKQIGGIPAGASAATTVPEGHFDEGKTYSWRAWAHDDTEWGPWGPWCEFTIDTVKPGAPRVSSTDYPDDNSWGHGGAGSPGTVTLRPAGDDDVAGYIYQLDSGTKQTEITAIGDATITLTPAEDGRRTLTVRAKDRAGNLSEPTAYSFNAGRAGIVQPAAGSNVVERAKLAISGDPALTHVTYQYRRGPGGVVHDIPAAHLRKADGSSVTTLPVKLSELGTETIWNAVDSLGTVGGVVQVRAHLSANDGTEDDTPYDTGWVSVNIDPDGDGAAIAPAGPGSVNLLTGDHTLSASDVDESGLKVVRTASSRSTEDGWVKQGERLTANQQQISTDTAGYTAHQATVTRNSARGQGASTDSLEVRPGGADSFASPGGDTGALRLAMKPGRRYRVTGWIYVPSAAGLAPANTSNGLRIVGVHKDAGGTYRQVSSAKAAWTDAWQELTVDLDVPPGATEAFFRLYNGHSEAARSVYYDNLSVREVVAPFGPQWKGGATDGGTGNLFTTLEFPQPELAKVNTVAGGYITFARNSAGQFFPAPGAEDFGLTKVSDTEYRLTTLNGPTVRFGKQGGTFTVTETWPAGADSTSRYLYDTTDGRALLRRVANPREPGIGDCTTAVPARGCEVLEYVYATRTTATAQDYGDFTDRVRAVKLWNWDPDAGEVNALEIARYAYDAQGRLRESWNPRMPTAPRNGYTYDSAGRVTKVTVPGELPWMFDYGSAGADTHEGRLLRTRRAALEQGTKDRLAGETTTQIVYGVPTGRAAGGPHNMDHASIATWAQQDLPTDATAIFGPESSPGTSSATAAKPGKDGYALATVHYLNSGGQEINTAIPGGHISTTEYDRFGNTVRELSAANRALALGTTPEADRHALELDLPADSALRAQLLSTVRTYSRDGTDLTETLAPLVPVALEHDLADPEGRLPKLAAGTVVAARPHKVNRYDENKPDGKSYHLVTTETATVAVSGYPDGDVRVTRSGYAAEKGGTSGWQLRKRTSVTTDAGTSFLVYDDAGRVTQDWGIGAGGSDARTSIATAYTAGTNSADSRCGNRPEWAGKPCVTKAAGSVTGHDPARSADDLPVKWAKDYTRSGALAVTVESAVGKARTATTSYDEAGRATRVDIVSDLGTPLPAVRTEYDVDSGRAIKTIGNGVITREYDRLGRLVAYTDADGAVTRTEYDRYGRAVRTTDHTGSTTYTYDRDIEPRGMITSMTDSVAGTFGARYSAEGRLVKLSYPGGITRRDTLNAAGTATQRVYTKDADGTVLHTESVISNSSGQRTVHARTGGSERYAYDKVGRLAEVRSTDAAGWCTTRSYGYDNRTNRTGKKTSAPGADGACRTADTIEETHRYDTADRLQDPGFVHDAFGQVVKAPGGITNSYHSNGRVAGQQSADQRYTWTLDPNFRNRGARKERLNGSTWQEKDSKVYHYGDDSDRPRWIVENPDTGALTRNVVGPDGGLAAITSATGGIRLQLTDLHGDVALTVDPALTSPQFLTYDEFGMPRQGQAAFRYGWLGGHQRSSEALGGTVLMGARLYSPAIGRFLQTDPITGGSATAYDYCNADPVNCTDLEGTVPDWLKKGGKWAWSHRGLIATVVAGAACVATGVVTCVGLSALAFTVRTAQTLDEKGFTKASRNAILLDATLSVASTGLGTVAIGKYAKYDIEAVQKAATRTRYPSRFQTPETIRHMEAWNKAAGEAERYSIMMPALWAQWAYDEQQKSGPRTAHIPGLVARKTEYMMNRFGAF